MEDTATPQQVKMFFALLHECGIDAERGKERAKKRFNLASFTHATKGQLTYLIDQLKVKAGKLDPRVAQDAPDRGHTPAPEVKSESKNDMAQTDMF